MASRDFNLSRLAAGESVTGPGGLGAVESDSIRIERAGRAAAEGSPAFGDSRSPECPDGCRTRPSRAWPHRRGASRRGRRRPASRRPPRLRSADGPRGFAYAATAARAVGSAAPTEPCATPWWRIARIPETPGRLRSRSRESACGATRARKARRPAPLKPTPGFVHIPENVLSPLLSVTKTTDSG